MKNDVKTIEVRLGKFNYIDLRGPCVADYDSLLYALWSFKLNRLFNANVNVGILLISCVCITLVWY